MTQLDPGSAGVPPAHKSLLNLESAGFQPAFRSLRNAQVEPKPASRGRSQVWAVAPFLALLSVLLQCAVVTAAEPSLTSESAKPNFTQIQDLNPEKRGVNRPVRQKWAVVIGVSKFRDKRLDTEIEFDKTSRRFYDYLVDPHGGRFSPDHVRLMTDEAASQASIDNSLGPMWLGKLAGPDDLVVVYIATKAFPTTDGNSYLCSYNCAMDNIYGTCMSIKSMMESLRKNVKSDRVVLVLESAYSGGAQLSDGAKSLESKTLKQNFNVDLENIALGKGYVILTSSLSNQLSWKDLFSDNLIKALKQNDGLVPLQDAFAKARQQTEYDSVYRMAAAKKQTPQMKSDWKGNDLVIGCVPVDETRGIPDSVRNFIGAEAHYLNANKAVMNGDFDTAITEYKAAIATDPDLADAIADYAVTLSMKGQWADAETQMRRALALKPQDVLFLSNYARILDKLGRPDECKRALEKAYGINPKDRVVLMALSDKCVASGDRQTAMQLVDQTLVLYPENAPAHDRMAFLLSMEGRTDEAISQAKEAIKLDPELSSARLKYGSLLLIRGESDAGIAEYETVLTKNPKNVDAHYLLAQALEKANDRKNAIREFNEFLQLASPQDARRNSAEQKLRELGAVMTN